MQLTKTISVLLALSSAIFIAGCSAPEGGFPSLSKRPFELAQPDAPVEEAVVVPARLPDEMQVRLDGLLNRHQQARDDFEEELPRVRDKVVAAADAAVGDELWVVAQMDLSRLDKIRENSLSVLGDIDLISVAMQDAESKGEGEVISPLIAPYQEQIAGDIARQNAEIDNLSAMLSQ